MPFIDIPISISLAEHLTPEERSQLVETVEALKTFTQDHPDDDQALEILKDAYWRLGEQAEGLAVTRKLADAYLRQGQYSSAMLEYEGILLHEPDSEEVQKILADLEAKLNRGKGTAAKASIALDFGLVETSDTVVSSPLPSFEAPDPQPTLIATADTRMPNAAPVAAPAAQLSLDDDGNDPLARFIVQHRLASQDAVEKALQRLRKRNADILADPNTPSVAAGLLDELIQAGIDAEPLLAAILDRTRFAYVPLECYDIDRQIVKMLPEHLSLGRRIVPFDIVSRTMMVAIDNPFDTVAKTVVQQSVDYHIQWYMAMPNALQRILRDSYRLAG